MKYFPLGLDLQDKACLIVGGGGVALRKCKALAGSGATIELVAPEVHKGFKPFIDSGRVRWLQQSWEPDVERDFSLDRYTLVIAATDQPDVNAALARRCQQSRTLVNVVSGAASGSVLLPAIVARDEVTVAVHSDGQSPTITRYLKQLLEAFIPAEFGRLSQWAESWRRQVAEGFGSPDFKRRFWHQVLSSPIRDLVLKGDLEQANQQFHQQLADARQGKLKGQVLLVGAGPGDPELLTVKALKLIQQAEVVLYDRLVSPEIMALLPASAERIYVGKRKADHSVPQPDINQLLVQQAKAGKQVLRLKGGDPFIFGRGGEELEQLVDEQVAFQVVPGITAASGCASYAGIPLTHRDHSQSVRFVTGHLKSEKDELDWSALAQPGQTLVFYMGLSQLATIMNNLIAHGADTDLAVAIIEKGTTRDQRVTTATVSTICDLARSQQFRAPTLVIVGSVVALRDQLQWL